MNFLWAQQKAVCYFNIPISPFSRDDAPGFEDELEEEEPPPSRFPTMLPKLLLTKPLIRLDNAFPEEPDDCCPSRLIKSGAAADKTDLVVAESVPAAFEIEVVVEFAFAPSR